MSSNHERIGLFRHRRLRSSVSAYIDNELGPDETAEVRDHLRVCPGCAAIEAQLRRIVSSLKRTSTRHYDELVVARVTEQWSSREG